MKLEPGKVYRLRNDTQIPGSFTAKHGYLFLVNTKQSQGFEGLSGTRLVTATSVSTGESIILFARELEPRDDV
jgi:hypothetical protein